MKRSIVAAAIVFALGTVTLFAQEPPAPKHAPPAPDAPIAADTSGTAAPPFETLEKTVGYAVGRNIGSMLKAQQADGVDFDMLVRGIREGLANTAPAVSESVIQEAVKKWQQLTHIKAIKAAAEAAEKNKKEGVAFLEKNKTEDGVKVTPTGLQYKVLKPGNGQGQKPTRTDSVSVQYEGQLVNGTVFDSSYRRGQPTTFGVSQVIPGWTEGLQLMEVGSTFMFYIPGDLAYGVQAPQNIGPNQTLIFKVELIEIKAGPPGHPMMPPSHNPNPRPNPNPNAVPPPPAPGGH